MRSGRIERETLETRIRAEVDLDGAGLCKAKTGVGFLDHMIAQLARHGQFDIVVEADGDLHVDAHHTVEDVAITLGQAFGRALGDRSGIARMGHAVAPMEESLALVAVDVGGRPMLAFKGEFGAARVGELDTQLIPHFLGSFADHLRANIHVHLLAGNNDHHRSEAIFKALAKALDAATALDPRRAGQTPSTKGLIDDAAPRRTKSRTPK